MIIEKQNRELNVSHNLDSLNQHLFSGIRNYKIGTFSNTVNYKILNDVYKFKDSNILVIDSLGVYDDLSFSPEYVLLTDSPRINMNRFIDSIKPKKMISDASNYKSYVERWKVTCYNKKICISVIIHNPVMLAITSLSKIRSPKYLRFSL